MEELKEIKILHKKIVTFKKYQHQWNTFMEGKYEVNQINISIVPIFKARVFVGTVVAATKEKMERKEGC